MQKNRDKNSKPSKEVGIEGLPVIRPDVAGVDLGSEIHWVCAPNVERTGLEVETFGATTPELERMAEWMKARKIESVAMESTGVYWIAPHEVLERHGLEIVLVNTRTGPRARAEEDGPGGLSVDPAAAQLRAAEGLLPA